MSAKSKKQRRIHKNTPLFFTLYNVIVDYLKIAAINSIELITILITSAANLVSIKVIIPPPFLVSMTIVTHKLFSKVH